MDDTPPGMLPDGTLNVVWHTEDCPLYEIDEDDCTYDRTKCTCGYTARSS